MTTSLHCLGRTLSSNNSNTGQASCIHTGNITAMEGSNIIDHTLKSSIVHHSSFSFTESPQRSTVLIMIIPCPIHHHIHIHRHIPTSHQTQHPLVTFHLSLFKPPTSPPAPHIPHISPQQNPQLQLAHAAILLAPNLPASSARN